MILLEALFALMIFSVGITVCIKSMLANVRAMALTRDYFYVLHQIDNTMLDYLQRGFISADINGSKEVKENQIVYKLDVNTHPINSLAEDSALNEITLEMTWAKGNKKNKIEIVSYVYKNSEE